MIHLTAAAPSGLAMLEVTSAHGAISPNGTGPGGHEADVLPCCMAADAAGFGARGRPLC